MLRFVRNERGAMAVLMALSLPLLIGAAALGVDLAALYHQKRVLQAGVDMAAIAAVGNPETALERAAVTLADAGLIHADFDLETIPVTTGGPLQVQTGRYDKTHALIAERFSPGESSINAVRVTMRREGKMHFAPILGIASPALSASAVAAIEGKAGFSIGTRLARIDGGLLNDLFGPLLGTSLGLTLVDYNGLAALELSLLDVLDALAGQIGVSAGTYGQVLEADIALANIAAALATAASGPDPVMAGILLDLAGAIDDRIVVEMARLIVAEGLTSIGIGQAHAGLDATVDALSLLSASAFAADGSQQAGLALALDALGFAGLQASLAIGQPPQSSWFTLGQEGSFVRSAQIRLKIVLSNTGNGGLGIGVVSVHLPVYVEIAPAQAELTALHCPHGPPSGWSADISARPGIARLAIGDSVAGGFEDMSMPLSFAPATIASVAGLANVKARSDVLVHDTSPQVLRFGWSEIGTTRTVGTSGAVSGLVGSLFSTLTLELELLGLGLIGGLLTGLLNTVNALISPLAPTLDTVLGDLLALLGVGLGEADLRLHALDCRAPALVQ